MHARQAGGTDLAKKIFIGIDGGGTKTTVLAADEDGVCLSKHTGETTNYYVTGLKQSQQNLRDILKKTYSDIDRREVAYVLSLIHI